MGIPAKTLIKVKGDGFQSFCKICNEHNIPVLNFEQDNVGGTVYVSLHSPKGQILNIVEKIKPYIIGNVSGY